MKRSEVPSVAKNRDIYPQKKSRFDPSDLLKPFKVPFKTSTRSRRSTRKAVNYKELGVADPSADGYGQDWRKPFGHVDRNKFMESEQVLTQQFKVPIKEREQELSSRPPPSLGLCKPIDMPPRPLHDPCEDFAIVLYDPTIDDEPVPVIEEVYTKPRPDSTSQETEVTSVLVYKKFKKPAKSLVDILGLRKPDKKVYPKVPVVVDPRLSKILRPHQVEGVKFMYKCVTGRVKANVTGCIMADEMGLGKTLQCISLMWSLLKQSPEGNKGVISKCIIACPASLVTNWANELVKWLGEGAVIPFAVDGKSVKGGAAELGAEVRKWAMASGKQVVRPVLIISYDGLRLQTENLKNCEVGLLLCDEGHKLKNSENVTYKALDSINAARRVVLTGTPVQNNLKEYVSILNFALPNLVGSPAEFRRNFGNAIMRGRDADATDQEQKVSDEKLQELTKLVNPFIIRRTNDLLSKFLPTKYECVVFCDLSPFQRDLYELYANSSTVKEIVAQEEEEDGKRKTGVGKLVEISKLRKLCNHPDLLKLPEDLEGSEQYFPEGYTPMHMRFGRDRDLDCSLSGKFRVLERMLWKIKTESDDKIVLISNFTETLDIIERMCRARRYGTLRLDGSMQIKKRQKLVDKFNNPNSEEFIFLLSSKAGGCGINLIGANRLILLDPDWNPASDQQALARVWRDGQKKTCFVYRFISTGTIEEKIFQRQSMKQSLSSCVVDEKEGVERVFSSQDLRQLFKYRSKTLCDTHDTFKCKRCRDGKQLVKAPAMLYGDATTWNHFSRNELLRVEDHLLKQEKETGNVSFVFQYMSH
ncbi:DNA repair and recombination protein Rad54p [Trichomonascus vanleenenianus]|uniref:DNA-dependent ATPase RAD54 n=1 Tax=Trichomonascus vanleenenianus TaxID=2268995 RepID=UPI003EC9F34F